MRATSSAAVSWGLGYADGSNLPFAKLVNLSENILRVISLPLSMDVEGGYRDNPDEVAQNVKQLVDLGLSGQVFSKSIEDIYADTKDTYYVG